VVFFATVNVALGVDDTPWATRAHAHDDVFEYIEAFYNGQRRHSTLACLSPLAFERQWAATRGTPSTPSHPIGGRSPQDASSIEALGATRTRGAAISVSPQSLVLEPITRHAGTLEVEALISSAPQCSAPKPRCPRNRGNSIG
jgi:hypothetical protein